MTVLARASSNLTDRELSAVRQSPVGKDVNTEAEESTLLGAEPTNG
jgi:hypothetical protein